MFENENNFAGPSLGPSKRWEELDSVLIDPFVERVLDMGRTYNTIFEEATPSVDESVAIVNELDKEWGNIKGTAIHYTGTVKLSSLEHEGELIQVFLDGARVVSNGFCLERTDDPDSESYRVRHHMHVKFEDAYGVDPEEHKGKLTIATGDIDRSIIELDGASPERAKAWLSISCPELIEEIDFRALNGSGDEDDALLALRGLDFNRYADLNDLFTRNCLNVYLQSIVEVDTAAPYSADLSGYVRDAEDLTSLYDIKADAILLNVGAIGMQPAFTPAENDTGWELAASISILGVTRDVEPLHYVLPVDSIQRLKSIRTAYYEEND